MARKTNTKKYNDEYFENLRNQIDSIDTTKKNDTGKWYADGSKWVYEDPYGNKTYDTGNKNNNYNGIDSSWNGTSWVGNTVLDDPNERKQNLSNQYVTEYTEYMKQQAAEREAERQSAIEEAYAAQRRAELERQQAQIGQINNLRPEYNQQAEMTAQQAYINKMLAEKGLNEKLAANGLSGTGVSESAKISNENNYGNSLNQTLQARDDALRGLDNQIQAVRSGGNANLSAIEAAYQQQVLNALEQQRQEEWQMKQYQDAMAQQQWQNNFNQQQFDTANNQWNQQFDYQKQQDALAAQQALQAAAARSYSSGSSGSKSGSSAGVEQNTFDEQKINNAVVYAQRKFYQDLGRAPTENEIFNLIHEWGANDEEAKAIARRLGLLK